MTTKVLVIDDSLMVRQQVKRALGADFTFVEAVDGVDALEKLAATPEAALIICDVNMPRMGGLEFLESRSRDSVRIDVPVVMLTTEGQSELIQRAKSLGAKGWLVKPFKPDMLLTLAKKLTAAA
jgi:two-component system, chemotaxis family, chemotaxis protein CheY